MSLTTFRGAAAAVLAVGAALTASAAANAAEVILFDGNNCSGQYRMSDRSISDFNQIGFDNEVNSLMVITGTWTFHRDANYGNNSGPQFQLGPSGSVNTCWSLADASGGSFPDDRMSSMQLVQDSGQPQPTGVAIIYDFANFGGNYRILTRDVADFNAIGFDNDVESIRVISGSWTFYRNANYGASPDRPSITLGPGEYPNVASVPGYPAGTFPGDLMSSAQVQASAPPPPPPDEPPLQCAAGEIEGNTQCVPCAQYQAVPDPAGNACVCPPGWEEVDSGLVDGVPVQLCQEASAPPPTPTCPGPYQYLDPATNQCAFQCHQSTQPNYQTGECDCLPGTEEAGLLNDGRRYCLGSTQPQQPAQPVRYTVPGAQIIPAAQAAGFTMVTTVDRAGATCQIQGDAIVFRAQVGSNQPYVCTVTMFGGRGLAPGWQFEDYNAAILTGQANPAGLTAQLPFMIQLRIPPFEDEAMVRISSIDLIGPGGQNWQAALQ